MPTDWQDRSTWVDDGHNGMPPLDEAGEPDRSDERVRKTWDTTLQQSVRGGATVQVRLPAPPPKEPV